MTGWEGPGRRRLFPIGGGTQKQAAADRHRGQARMRAEAKRTRSAGGGQQGAKGDFRTAVDRVPQRAGEQARTLAGHQRGRPRRAPRARPFQPDPWAHQRRSAKKAGRAPLADLRQREAPPPKRRGRKKKKREECGPRKSWARPGFSAGHKPAKLRRSSQTPRGPLNRNRPGLGQAQASCSATLDPRIIVLGREDVGRRRVRCRRPGQALAGGTRVATLRAVPWPR